jgi:hypothetical protein
MEMDRVGTKTLYRLVKEWSNQPWGGIRNIRICEELWNSIEAYELIEGPFGDSVTLLESCIVDSNEALDAGLLSEEQALNNLRDLLENDDFVLGARIIEVSVESNPVCRISNIDSLLQKEWPIGPQKPQWWKRSVRSFWLFVGVVSFAIMIIISIIMIELGTLPPVQLFLAVAIGIPLYASSYYFRTIATKRMWRVVFILLGSCFIGFWFILVPLTFLLVFSGVWSLLGPIPWWLGMPLLTIPPLVTGAIIGDWLGKRRDYRPYM